MIHSGFEQLQLHPHNFNHSCSFTFDNRHYRVNSNSNALLTDLQKYFAGYENQTDKADIDIYLWQADKYQTDIPWQNWSGEAGKTRLKEQFWDVADGRWIHKYKTGMVMFQHMTAPLAVGPCVDHLSQIVNFIINQHINFLQQSGGLICHAACLQVGNSGIAIAAHSGGGKSTTMLKLMEQQNSRFISNDRLFLYQQENTVVAKGVAKQPRVNPGTLLNNARLTDILPVERQTVLKRLTTAELWQQEEKYDVMVSQYYGQDKLGHQTPLEHVILLNWLPGGSEPVKLQTISLDDRPELIKAIAKSPGSFYQDTQGHFLMTAQMPVDHQYQDMLRHLKVWEVTGGADFDALLSLINSELAL